MCDDVILGKKLKEKKKWLKVKCKKKEKMTDNILYF